MSDDIVIRAEGLGKQYTIGHQAQRERYTALRDVIARGASGLIQSARDMLNGRPIIPGDTLEEFWALKDVGFEIRRGEVVGIIGCNGAGKSTLLKILSRITDPSEGRVTIKGRVASLLEVGTGFHPELTGRENVFLNGAILGMSREEIRRKFDEIIAFAEVEQFLDTPVKRYSSGMYVRLAFAVAAHLEPEILVVDEVLAVGDAAFQKKCLGKMQEVGKQGRTVLFVSHNMAAVENLCTTGVILDHGSKVFQGDVSEAVNRYLNAFVAQHITSLVQRTDRQGRGRVRITRLIVRDASGRTEVAFSIGSALSFHVHYAAEGDIANPRAVIGVYDNKGVGITRFDSGISGGIQGAITKQGSIVCATQEINLTPGRYFINVAFFSNEELEDYLISAAFFDVRSSDFFSTGKMFNESDAGLAKILVRHDWTVGH